MQPGTRMRIKAKEWIMQNSTHYRIYETNFRVLKKLQEGTELEKYLVIRTEALEELCGQLCTFQRMIERGVKANYAEVKLDTRQDKRYLPKQMLEVISEEQISLF